MTHHRARRGEKALSRRLRLEALESRRLLSSDAPLYGPPLPEIFERLESTDVSTTVCEKNKSRDEDAQIIPLTGAMGPFPAPCLRGADFSTNQSTLNTVDMELAFESEGIEFYRCKGLDEEGGSLAEKVVFDDYPPAIERPERAATDVAFSASVLSSAGTLSGGGSGGEVCEIGLTVDASHASSDLADSFEGIVLVERFGALCDETDFFSGANYFIVETPALPHGYVAEVSFSGTAIYGIDYVAYYSDGNSVQVYPQNVFEYSGGSQRLWVVPINDAVPESLETIFISLGEPYIPGSGGGSGETTFHYGATTVTATIVDDDNWTIVVERADENGISVAASEETVLREIGASLVGESGYFDVSLVYDGYAASGDRSYSVEVLLGADGSATPSGDRADYALYRAGDADWIELTPVETDWGTAFQIEIPANQNGALIRVEALLDGIVEELYETVEFIPLRGYASPSTEAVYETDDASVVFTIEDGDELRVGKLSFRNNLNLLSEASDFFGCSWRDGPHWFENDASKTTPVAYSCDDFMSAIASISGDFDADLICEVKGTRVGGGETDWIVLDSMTREASASFTESFLSIFGERRARYEPSCEIDWIFRVNGVVRSFATKTTNPLYVTYAEPEPVVALYHTVVHTGCVAASQASLTPILATDDEEQIETKEAANADAVFEAIAAKFATLCVKKINLFDGVVVEGDVLTYYGKDLLNNANYSAVKAKLSYTEINGNATFDQLPSRAREFALPDSSVFFVTTCYMTSGLLYYQDGTCGGWQDFGVNVLRSQGLSDVFKVSAQVPDKDKRFKVKTTARGQGNLIPRENTWWNHAIIMYRNRFWDPSYGLDYGSGEVAVIETNANGTCLTISCETAQRSFINNLDSIGVVSEYPYVGYGYRYAPEKMSYEITFDDLKFIKYIL